MPATLVGVRNKIKRANNHLSELKVAIDRWGTSEDKNNLFVVNHQPERGLMVLRHGKVAPNDPDWPLIVGDIVHNLRSALDHLVCQLAILNGNDVSCCDKTYFPICICKPDFAKAKRMVEPLISPEAFTSLEELQPYNAANIAGKEPTSSNLWIISKLDIVDKHRMLVVVGKFFRTIDLCYTFNDGDPVKVDVDDTWRPLEDGTKIASIDLAKLSPGPEDKMRVQGGTEVQVFISETGCGCDGLEVGVALLPCIRYVTQIVDLFEAKFFS
jgi:hypothetical protein